MSEKTPHNADQDIELNNSKNSGQIGQAGRDLVQIGRDYIQFIYKNSRSGNWGMVVIAVLPLFLILFGVKAGADRVVEIFEAKSAPTPIPKTTPIPTTSLPINPSPTGKDSIQPDASQSNEFQFPQNSCGDKSTDSNSTWYPVFINGGNLYKIQQKYCKDAINATRQTGEQAILVASFISDTKALKFAKAVGGEVGEPSKPNTIVSPQLPSNSGNQSSVSPSAADATMNRGAKAAYDAGLQNFKLGNMEEAIRQFTQSIIADDSRIEPYFYRGMSLETFGRCSEAVDDYIKVIQTKSLYGYDYNGKATTDPETYNFIAGMFSANMAAFRGNTEKAIETLETFKESYGKETKKYQLMTRAEEAIRSGNYTTIANSSGKNTIWVATPCQGDLPKILGLNLSN